MRLNTNLVLPIVVLMLAISIGTYYLFFQVTETYSGPIEKISIGTTKQELSTLIWIAKEKGYFQENGLDATVKSYDTGIETKNALIAGEVDVADTVDFVISGLALEGVDFKVLSSIDTATIDYITARKDRGISNLSDLKGKKIGIKRGSSAEYYLGRTLLFNDVSLEDVELVAVHPPDMPEAIAQGEIDATITWHPHNYNIKKRLGDNAIVWPAQAGQDIYWVVFCKDEFVQEQPEKIKRLLKSLIQAEEFIKHNELEAKEIIANRLNLDLDYIKSVWSDFTFEVRLTQDFILTLEDQARWKINQGMTNATESPNYLDYVYISGLESIKPEAVSIIR